jgi:HNH endonuclease
MDWRRLRAAVLESEPSCRHCRNRGIRIPAVVVDHIQSIRDAPELRLDPTNLQPLCWRCQEKVRLRFSSGTDRLGSHLLLAHAGSETLGQNWSKDRCGQHQHKHRIEHRSAQHPLAGNVARVEGDDGGG